MAAAGAPALEKGLDILEILAAGEGPMTVREIATAMGRSKSEIFRMVQVLVGRGYLSRDAFDRVALTNRLFDLGLRTPPTRDISAVAGPLIAALAQEICQAVHLVVPNRGETVVIAAASGGSDMTFSLKLGYRRPLIESHSGLLLMALQPASAREAMIADSLPLADRPVERAALNAQLARIAADGHIVRDSRDVVGVTDIVAPVLEKRVPVATLVVGYLNRRRPMANHAAVLNRLKHVAADLTAALDGSSTGK